MSPLETDLETLHQHPTPDPAFAARLQRDLRARAERLETPTPQPARLPRALPAWGLFRRTWATAALAFVLILAALVLFADPQRVWAGIQQFFRYVPGVGFVDLENARVLSAPVAVEREGITFIVTQVIATTGRTTVRFEVQGLPPGEEIWPQGGELNDDFRAQLRLSEDATLDSGGMMLGLVNGQIEFPALPTGTKLVFLEFNHIPLTPPGMFPEQWAIPLTLQPLEGEPDKTLYAEPYTPENATDTHYGITATVLQVAQASEGTAVQLMLESEYPAHYWDFTLRDDIGHLYGQSYEETSLAMVEVVEVPYEEIPSTTSQNVSTETDIFYPVSLSARQLTLEISGVVTTINLKGSFTMDLGDNPHIGDTWTLDIPLEFAGLTARVTGARLSEMTDENEGHLETSTVLEFFIQAEPAADGRSINMISISNPQAWFGSGSGAEGGRPGEGSMKAYVLTEPESPIPHGLIEIQLEDASIYYPGPWILTWPIPRGKNEPDQPTHPVLLHPDARDTQNDITLSISETVQTDRLFALALEAENLPAGTEFLWPIAWGTDPFNPTEVTLSDNLGNTVPTSSWKTSWEAYQKDDFTQSHLNFDPPNPLANQLTLNIPAVHLFMHAQTHFDITLLADRVPIGENLEDWPDIPPEGAWEVDIPLEIAGFQVHFTHAWLENRRDAQTLVLYTEDVTEQVGHYYLTGLQMETVQAPNGQTWHVPLYPAAYGFAGQIPGTSTSYAMLRIEAFNPEQPTLLPGTYHVQLNGVIVTVPGPWELNWDLLGP